MVYIAAIIGLVLWIIVAVEFAGIAEEKGYDGTKYGWLTFLTAFAGMLMVIALPDRNARYAAPAQPAAPVQPAAVTEKDFSDLPEL